MKVVVAALFASPNLAAAAYRVQGDQEGSFCTGFGIEVCAFKSIDATLKGGQLYELKEDYKTVDEYHDGKCWIRILFGILNRVIGDIPTFLNIIADIAICDRAILTYAYQNISYSPALKSKYWPSLL